MSDLISKKVIQDALLEKISRLNAEGEKSIGTAMEFCGFKRFVDGITPVNTTDRPTGEWIESDEYNVTGVCSVCGWESILYETDIADEANFCPNCGAYMGGNKHE